MINNNETGKRTVVRYRRRSILLHWVHTAAFIVLIVTGAFTFFQVSGFSDFYVAKILHRVAAVIFIAIPIVNYLLEPRPTSSFFKETFKWSRDDVKWVTTAPDYYFGGREGKMPAQGRLNAGQKLWQAVIIVTGLIFVITGIILWGFQLNLPLSVYEWILFVHGIAFIIVTVMFVLHLYLGLFHPRFRESFRSMLDGRISISYARTHYRKWYDKES